MANTSMMETYDARLASFNITYPVSKKRNSDSKGTKSTKWCHKSPTPAELARAGFFYQPTPTSPDNTQCFLCGYNLDGWEEDDNAIVEHSKLSPGCGWAIIAGIEAEVDDENAELDPLTGKLLNARKMTFGSRWPHETKKGWICKTQKMIESGWYYSPTEEGDDYVKCPYCGLAVDGWEPEDDPFDEHQRRTPDCKFFSLLEGTKPKAGRPKKSRVSKVSRLSTQSDFTVHSAETSIVEGNLMEDHGGLLFTDEVEQPTKTGRGRKKAPKAKKSAKAKRKAAKTEAEELPQASSFIEPEDDNFEVKVETIPLKNVKSKKRSSDEMNEDHETQQSTLGTPDIHSQPPAMKRRVTRSRSSAMHTKNVPIPSFQNGYEIDTLMTDTESAVPPAAPASKKGTKKGRKRASSTVRKASARSTASVAPLRGVPDDDVIDAALEADLDRPLTDDETIANGLELPNPKTRRLTRTRPGSRNEPASVASVRINARKGNMTNESMEADEQETEMQDIDKNTNTQPSNSEDDNHVTSPMPKQDVTKEIVLPDSLPMPEISLDPIGDEQMHIFVPPPKYNTEPTPAKPKALKSRQPSRHVIGRSTRASVVTTAEDVPSLRSDLSSSGALSQAEKDESEHENDVSVIGQGPKKRKGNKRIGVLKKGKLGKKTLATGHNIEDIIQPTIENARVGEPEDATCAVATGLVSGMETSCLNSGPTQETSLDEKNIVELAIPRSPVVTPTSLSPRQLGMNAEEKEIASPALSVSSAEAIKGFSRPLPSPPTNDTEMKTPPLALPPAEHSIQLSETQKTPRIVASPQSSDAENQPPSSRPSATRPPIPVHPPSSTQSIQVPLASATPTGSPSKRNTSRLQSSVPWTAIELEKIFLGSPAEKENNPFTVRNSTGGVETELGSPEKKLSVEEWVQFNAKKGEARLRNECERLVGKFESEGIRALRTLEGVACVD